MDRKLQADLERDEGRVLTAYKDTNGFWTIGVGHLLGAHARMTAITDNECNALLEWDVRAAIAVACRVFSVDSIVFGDGPNAVRGRAIVNMTFNRGETRMKNSTTITPAIKKGLATDDWAGITAIILVTPWAKQVGKRANRLAAMLETGNEPV
jgi:lysozyme